MKGDDGGNRGEWCLVKGKIKGWELRRESIVKGEKRRDRERQRKLVESHAAAR